MRGTVENNIKKPNASTFHQLLETAVSHGWFLIMSPVTRFQNHFESSESKSRSMHNPLQNETPKGSKAK